MSTLQPTQGQRLNERNDSPHLNDVLPELNFAPIAASQLGSGDDIQYLWQGFVAEGFITMLVGLFKAGKTTLLAHVLRATAHGGDIAGRIGKMSVLVVTEEAPQLWARRRDTIGIGDNVAFAIRPFKGRPTNRQWRRLLELVADDVRAGMYKLVVFDTFASVSPCADENDAACMLTALRPLHLIAEAGGAVLLIHHPRKSDGGEGRASRGSTALPGFVDVIMELRRFAADRHNDSRRILTTYSRFAETPPRIVIELADGEYCTLGAPQDVSPTDRRMTISKLLAASESALTVDDILARWSDDGVSRPGKRTLRDDLDAGAAAGCWIIEGRGVRGDPHRFRPVARDTAGTDAQAAPLV